MIKLKKGSVVEIEYVGRVKETGKIFDLTSEETAKKEGLYTKTGEYGPRRIVVGANYIIPGLDEELEKMKVGEEKEVELSSEKAFGKRDLSLIKVFSERAFRKNKVNPEIGSMVAIGTSIGRIISRGSGRVRVDLNHPLAGKKLVYKIKINKEIKKEDEKLSSILKHRLGSSSKEFEFDHENKAININIKDITPVMQEKIRSDIKLCLPDIKKVNFK